MNRLRLPLAVVLPLFFVSVGYADWTATGTFRYTNRLYNQSGWTGLEERAVRKADVHVFDLNSNTLLGTAATDANGSFSISINDNLVRDVGVRVLASTILTPGVNFEVVDDMNGLAVYTYQDFSADVLSHDPNDDVDFGTMVMPAAIGSIATTDWSSQVFNAFDMGILTAEWIEVLDGTVPTVNFEVRWNPNNGRSGSFYNGGSNAVFMSDDDGYDDPNILHEFGHFIEDEFGRSRNTGGSHTGSDDDQDPRLAWSEGYASYFSSACLDEFGLPRPDLYSDRNSFGTSGGFSIAYEGNANGGSTQERAVTAALYDLVDSASSADSSLGNDDDPLSNLADLIWAVTEEMRVRNLPATNLEDFWDIWFELGHGNLTQLTAIFAAHQIDFAPDSSEPNDLASDATPLTVNAGYLEQTFYRTGPDPAGDEDWFRFAAVAGQQYWLEVSGTPNTIYGRPDPELALVDVETCEVLAFSQDPLDTQLNSTGSFSAQDMDETVPRILWRAPESRDYHMRLCHAGGVLNIMRYGTYSVRVDSAGSPNVSVTSVSVVPLRPGQEYSLLVRGSNFAVGATLSSSNADVSFSEALTLSPEVIWARVSVGSGAQPGTATLQVNNPGGGTGSLSAALEIVNGAAPQVVITEVELGGEDRVELRNLGTVTADLTNWQLIGQTTNSDLGSRVFTFPSFQLPPGASVVVSEAPGSNTATELYDVTSAVSWPWNNSGTGHAHLVDDAGQAVDFLRWVQGWVTNHIAPQGTGMIWMQPELFSPPGGFTLARAEDAARYRTTHGLSWALPSIPDGSNGRENHVDRFEDNEVPRRAPLLSGNSLEPNLAISPRPSGDDEDWFAFLVRAGDDFAVAIDFVHSQGNLSLEVYAPGADGPPLASSVSSNDNESVSLDAATTAATGSGAYLVRVFGVNGATNSYDLETICVLGADCNNNNQSDAIDIAFGVSPDCDGNGVPDECDIAAGLDCNSNLVPDACDIANGTSLDGNQNGIPDECELPEFVRGDCNGDTSFNIADGIALLGFLFPTGGVPVTIDCLSACDCNDSGGLDISDAICILEGLFGMPASPPSAPHPLCGTDPTPDTLTCDSFVGCP